jgi:hypothetical protein
MYWNLGKVLAVHPGYRKRTGQNWHPELAKVLRGRNS